MKKTIITWLVNASVAAFAVGALQVPFKGLGSAETPALVFSGLSLIAALVLSKEKS